MSLPFLNSNLMIGTLAPSVAEGTHYPLSINLVADCLLSDKPYQGHSGLPFLSESQPQSTGAGMQSTQVAREDLL